MYAELKCFPFKFNSGWKFCDVHTPYATCWIDQVCLGLACPSTQSLSLCIVVVQPKKPFF